MQIRDSVLKMKQNLTLSSVEVSPRTGKVAPNGNYQQLTEKQNLFSSYNNVNSGSTKAAASIGIKSSNIADSRGLRAIESQTKNLQRLHDEVDSQLNNYASPKGSNIVGIRSPITNKSNRNMNKDFESEAIKQMINARDRNPTNLLNSSTLSNGNNVSITSEGVGQKQSKVSPYQVKNLQATRIPQSSVLQGSKPKLNAHIREDQLSSQIKLL